MNSVFSFSYACWRTKAKGPIHPYIHMSVSMGEKRIWNEVKLKQFYPGFGLVSP